MESSNVNTKRKYSEIEILTESLRSIKIDEQPKKKQKTNMTYDEWCIINGYPSLSEQLADYWIDYEDHEKIKKILK